MLFSINDYQYICERRTGKPENFNKNPSTDNEYGSCALVSVNIGPPEASNRKARKLFGNAHFAFFPNGGLGGVSTFLLSRESSNSAVPKLCSIRALWGSAIVSQKLLSFHQKKLIIIPTIDYHYYYNIYKYFNRTNQIHRYAYKQ
jgi:hypothetical protein